jgi:hypothetical protein
MNKPMLDDPRLRQLCICVGAVSLLFAASKLGGIQICYQNYAPIN